MSDETIRYLASYLIDNSEKFAYLRTKFSVADSTDIAFSYEELLETIKEFFSTLP